MEEKLKKDISLNFLALNHGIISLVGNLLGSYGMPNAITLTHTHTHTHIYRNPLYGHKSKWNSLSRDTMHEISPSTWAISGIENGIRKVLLVVGILILS